ncbi:MAG: hypothetical protein ACTSUE_03240 [Promethearchaeota archaeon]
MVLSVYFVLFVSKSGYSPTDDQLAKLGSILERNGFIIEGSGLMTGPL